MKNAALAAAALALACGPVDVGGAGNGTTGTGTQGGAPDAGTSSADAGTPGGDQTPAPAAPSLAITAPVEGATVAVDDKGKDHDKLQVTVAAANVRISDSCGADAACGVLMAFVDDDACGNPNAQTTSGSQLTADLAGCGKKAIAGAHRLRAEVWRGSTQVARSADVHVTVTTGGKGKDG